MLRYLRNICVTLLTWFGVAFLYRIYMKRKGPLVRVIVFHDIPNAHWFCEVMKVIHENYHVLSPRDFADSRYDSTRINVLVTFDDGYHSWVDVGVPVLEEYGIKALFFVNAGLVDVYASPAQERYVREQLYLSPRATLSWDGVRTLSAHGHTIGGHSVTHGRLSLLHKDEQRREIEADKKRIETMIGEQITYFAYPFGQSGDFTAVTEALVKEEGYAYAFSTEAAFLNRTNLFRLPRICLENDMPISRVHAWIRGAYDIYHFCKRICVR